MSPLLPGTVVALDGRISTVRIDGPGGANGGGALACTLRGALKGPAGSSRVAPGDRVRVRPAPGGAGGEGVIEAVEERRTVLARGRGRGEQVIAANLDQLAIVASARDPHWRPGFVDRVLCAAGKGGLEPLIIVNKIDLVGREAKGAGLEEELRHDVAVFRGLGYRVLEVSAARGTGIDELRGALRGRLTVFSGQSGVGKSSLANAIEPGLALATREVSRATRKGRHTTSSARLVPLAGGGFVLDTPGIRSFGFWRLEPREVGALFRDIARVAPSCRFRDCLHLGEPECAVRYAAETGVIDGRRLESYARILASLEGEGDERE